MSRKRCSKCGKNRSVKFFSKNKATSDGLAYWCKDCQKKAQADWRARNKSKIKEGNKEWREQNPDYHREYLRDYYADEEQGEARRKRRIQSVRKWQAKSINYRLRKSVEARIRKAIRKKRTGLFRLLGYTVDELREHLESLFQPGMSWDNYGDWHVDHVVPHSKFQYTDEDDPKFRECWALSNLQPLWWDENLAKGKKLEAAL